MNSLVKAIHLSSFVLQILAKKFDPTRFSTEKSAPCPHMARTPSPSPQADQRRKSSAMGIQRNPYGVYIYIHVILSNHIIDILYYITYIMYVNEYIKPELNGLIWIINPYENGWMTRNTGFNKACFDHGTAPQAGALP